MTDAELEAIRRRAEHRGGFVSTEDSRDLLAYVDELRKEVETLRSQVCDLWDADGGAGGRAYLLGVAAGLGKAVAWLEQQADDLREKTITSDAFVLESYSAYLSQEYPTAPLAYPDQLRAENERLRLLLRNIVVLYTRSQRDERSWITREHLRERMEDARQLLGEQT
jgi:hypothetical protein